MQHRELGKSGIHVPVIGIGTWSIDPGIWGWTKEQEDNSIAAIQAAVDAGITLVDTAPAYGRGQSEIVVGKALQGRRDKVILASKVGLRIDLNPPGVVKLLSAESIVKECEDSLTRLGVDYIDIYQCHWPEPEYKTPHQETAEALMRLKEQGKIRAIGVSNYSIEQMTEFSKYAQLDSLQPQYSLVQREIEKEELPWCRERQIGILSYGSIGGGLLSGKYDLDNVPTDSRGNFYKFFKQPLLGHALKIVDVLKELAAARGVTATQMALAWTISQPGVTSALVGARNSEQAQMNAAAGDIILTDEENQKLDAACKEYQNNL